MKRSEELKSKATSRTSTQLVVATGPALWGFHRKAHRGHKCLESIPTANGGVQGHSLPLEVCALSARPDSAGESAAYFESGQVVQQRPQGHASEWSSWGSSMS